jgi:hypothetical protein
MGIQKVSWSEIESRQTPFYQDQRSGVKIVDEKSEKDDESAADFVWK